MARNPPKSDTNTLPEASLLRASALELARRSSKAGPIYLVVALVVILSSRVGAEFSLLSTAAVTLLALVGGARALFAAGLARILTASDKRLSTVLMTGYPAAQLRDDAETQGVMAFLQKPFQVSELRDAISKAVASTELNG